MTAEPETNPLRSGLRRIRRSPPGALVIFGASGDLAHRKLVPSLFALQEDDLLDDRTLIVGISRRDWTDGDLRAHYRRGVEEFGRVRVTDAAWTRFASRIRHHGIRSEDASEYTALAALLRERDGALDAPGEHTVYLSTPPSLFAPIAARLAAAGLFEGATEGRVRLVVEKPFGTDLKSARALNKELTALLPESAIYRIDHYLGKETVQNLLVFRFANGMFEPLWNAHHVEQVQITVAESIGVAGRGAYFEEAGIVRDMVQNHVFQFLALTAPGGKEIPGYLEEKGVPPDSTTETFVGLKMWIDNWRWAGVPWFLRVGKAMPKKVSEIAIHFRPAPHRLFGGELAQNVLAIRIQPDEGMSLRFLTKAPGQEMTAVPVTMDFRYGTSFGAAPPEAYERLLLDAMVGDGTLFTRADEVDASWTWISALRDAWAGSPVEVPESYEAGTWGPQGSDALLAPQGFTWRRP